MYLISLFETTTVFNLHMYKCLLFDCFQPSVKIHSFVNPTRFYGNTKSLFIFILYVVTLHKQGGQLGMVTLDGRPN